MDAARARATANSRSARTAVHLAAVAAALALVGATEGLRHDPMTVLAALPRQAWLLLGADAAPVPARNLGEQEEVAASPTSESPATTQAVETVAADPVTLATTEAPSPQAQEPWVDASKGGRGCPTDLFAPHALQTIRGARLDVHYE